MNQKEKISSKFSTLCVHGDHGIEKTEDVAPPLHVSVTFEGNNSNNIYARHSTETRTRLEELLGILCNGVATVYSSGQAAWCSLVLMLKPKRIIFSAKGYFGSYSLVQKFPEIEMLVGLENMKMQKGDVFFLESPLNPTVQLLDIEAFSKEAHQNGAIVVVDSTIGPPPLIDPITLGADYVYYSATVISFILLNFRNILEVTQTFSWE
jgi:cystathionine gamma-synthase